MCVVPKLYVPTLNKRLQRCNFRVFISSAGVVYMYSRTLDPHADRITFSDSLSPRSASAALRPHLDRLTLLYPSVSYFLPIYTFIIDHKASLTHRPAFPNPTLLLQHSTRHAPFPSMMVSRLSLFARSSEPWNLSSSSTLAYADQKLECYGEPLARRCDWPAWRGDADFGCYPTAMLYVYADLTCEV